MVCQFFFVFLFLLIKIGLGNSRNKILIVSEGAIPPLIDLLINGTLGGKTHAAGALSNLANNSANSSLISQLGGVC